MRNKWTRIKWSKIETINQTPRCDLVFMASAPHAAAERREDVSCHHYVPVREIQIVEEHSHTLTSPSATPFCSLHFNYSILGFWVINAWRYLIIRNFAYNCTILFFFEEIVWNQIYFFSLMHDFVTKIWICSIQYWINLVLCYNSEFNEALMMQNQLGCADD